MSERTISIVTKFTNCGYILGCIILYLIALCIIFSSVWSILQDMFSGNYSVYNLLDEVGLIVFSIAVLDVAKYLVVEEVIRRGSDRHPTEYRRAITKFSIIIVSALALEGLVLTIEMAKLDVTKILYPVAVLLTASIFMVGIGVYQRLNASAERD